MNYRDFGKTGEKISALGFGCMRLPEYEEGGKKFVDLEKSDAMIAKAYEQGVNYFDTAPYYCNKNSEAAVGYGVKAFRNKILLSSKFPGEIKKVDFRKQLESTLTNLGTDYLDFYHFWGINKNYFDDVIIWQDLLGDAQRFKEEGLIRHISFSFHDAPSSIKHIIDGAEKYGVPMESMLVQYNLLDRSNEEMIAYANSKGLGTVAMGPVGGVKLAAPSELTTKLTGGKSGATYELAFKFVLGNPTMNCALSGMQTLGESLEQLKKFSELYCTGCKYCQLCPCGIDIPNIFNMYTYHNVYDLKGHAQWMFDEYVKKGGKLRSSCVDCGKCEKACPQHLEIRKELDKVEAIFRK